MTTWFSNTLDGLLAASLAMFAAGQAVALHMHSLRTLFRRQAFEIQAAFRDDLSHFGVISSIMWFAPQAARSVRVQCFIRRQTYQFVWRRAIYGLLYYRVRAVTIIGVFYVPLTSLCILWFLTMLLQAAVGSTASAFHIHAHRTVALGSGVVLALFTLLLITGILWYPPKRRASHHSKLYRDTRTLVRIVQVTTYGVSSLGVAAGVIVCVLMPLVMGSTAIDCMDVVQADEIGALSAVFIVYLVLWTALTQPIAMRLVSAVLLGWGRRK